MSDLAPIDPLRPPLSAASTPPMMASMGVMVRHCTFTARHYVVDMIVGLGAALQARDRG